MLLAEMSVIDTLVASRLVDPDLAPAAINSAFRLYMLPQGMFSVAVATVLFPSLARLAARGEGAPDRRVELEARLVEEHQAGLTTPGTAADPGQLLTPSVVDGDLVPLPGFRCGFWLVHFSRRLRILRTCSGW